MMSVPRISLVLLLAAIGWAAFQRDDINPAMLALMALGLLAAIALLPRLIDRFRSPQNWTDAGDLKRRLDGGDKVTIVDVRSPDEFTGPLGHIARSRNIPLSELNRRVAELKGLERAPIVLVCRTDGRSFAAARILRAAGFEQVSVLRSGMAQWNAAGLPVEHRGAKRREETGS